MKKIILSLFLFLSFFSSSQNTTPDWTLTDLNGNQWHLYELTAAGKTIFIDFSATWCSPCIDYHNTHSLKELYEKHGPNGTISNSVMVFFIEADENTSPSQMGVFTQGTPYPLIDPGAQTNEIVNMYNIDAIPAVIKICPDNKFYDIGPQGIDGLVASINDCEFTNDALVTNLLTDIQCSNSVFNKFLLVNNGQLPLTSCLINYKYDNAPSYQNFTWSGNLNFGEYETVEIPVSEISSEGQHSIKLNVSNPNGTNDNNTSNNTITQNFWISTVTPISLPYENDFSNSNFPYLNWMISNPNNDFTWKRSATNGGSMIYETYVLGDVIPMNRIIDDLTMPPFNLQNTSPPSLKFSVAHLPWGSYYEIADSLEVSVSVDCGATWKSVWKKGGTDLATKFEYDYSYFTPSASEWREECIDLTEFAGQDRAYIRFTGLCTYKNNIYVDQIKIGNSECQTNQLGENTMSEFEWQIYPNIVTNQFTVSSITKENIPVNLILKDMQGRVIAEKRNLILNKNETFTFTNLDCEKGVYFVVLEAKNQTYSKKIIVQ